ncbi:serine/threonine-protein phosphatase 6 catalytic subunit [Anaeramoeba flamelloides]|uniref:Serine/threonine-protein phosphatase n=1 Tax=Anaeramoeba flamelloides TaxID=1746091 RepID=A0AAV7Z807_9EUKA|nr:serine/threonine-protein phosphatase 6 catalytic subunit [Anaeramoeba flamelloides]
MSNYSQLFSSLLEKKKIPAKKVIELLMKLKEYLLEENNILFINGPVAVVGDIHGQFYDLLELFKQAGYENIPNSAPPRKFVCLGDYVDRGHYGLEVVLSLFLLKLMYPAHFVLLRGNHECRTITQNYGFYEECFNHYQDLNIWKAIMNVFDVLPIGAVVDQTIFCVHGGLSPHAFNFFEIKNLWRFQEVPTSGGLCDLLWSDPTHEIENWTPSPRLSGWLFGEKVVDEFLEINNINLICRSHQIAPKGYYWWFEDDPFKPTKKKICTVWSAPNYLYTNKNEASVLFLENGQVDKFITFQASPNDPNHKLVSNEND